MTKIDKVIKKRKPILNEASKKELKNIASISLLLLAKGFLESKGFKVSRS